MPMKPKPVNYWLDGAKMTTVEAVHQHIADVLSFPSYYGHNLDALWDMLSEINTPVQIEFQHLARLREQLPEYSLLLIQLFEEAQQMNPALQIQWRD